MKYICTRADWQAKIKYIEYTCPPPSGKNMVSSRITSKPLTLVFFPLVTVSNWPSLHAKTTDVN